MPPKKAGSKKKEVELQEPEHDPSWERAVAGGVWDRTPAALPDANTWPTWGALRERILTACKEINITWSRSVRDAFAAEIVKLSPPDLTKLSLQGSCHLSKVVLSPITSCPKLAKLDLSHCTELGYVLLQSHSLQQLSLSNCTGLTKALIHCSKLEKLEIENCPNLDTIMIWSDSLQTLDLSDSKEMTKVVLHCPMLTSSKVPPLEKIPPPRVVHPPIAAMLKDSYRDVQHRKVEEEDWIRKVAVTETVIPKVYRPYS